MSQQSGSRHKCIPDVNTSCCHFQEKFICNVVDRLFSLCSAATLWQIHLASNFRKVYFLDIAILQKRAFYWQNEWQVQLHLRYVFNSKSYNIFNRNNGATFKETFSVTKSRCSRTDLIWTPNYFGQTFGLRMYERPDLRCFCVSARDLFASLVTGLCSVSVWHVSASPLRMCQRLSQGCFHVSTTSWIEHTLFPTSIYYRSSSKDAFTSGMHLRLGPDCPMQ